MARKQVEKRFEDRLDFQLLVSYKINGEEENNFSFNLSTGGMFIETTLPNKIGTPLSLKFEFPMDSTILNITGEVAWIRSEPDESGQPVGMGIKFTDVDDEKKEGLLKAVNYIEQSHKGSW